MSKKINQETQMEAVPSILMKKRNKWYAEIQWSDKNGEKHRKKFLSKRKLL